MEATLEPLRSGSMTMERSKRAKNGPPPHISSDYKDHLLAAQALSEHLDAMGCHHAYIGGFAWSLLGSMRPTHDIDVLIETEDILTVRKTLDSLDIHFAMDTLKLYFVKNLDGIAPSEFLVRQTRDNVLIETLPTGRLGLPSVAKPILYVTEYRIRILHPSVLILTKLNRWTKMYASTRPMTIQKNSSDRDDIHFLIRWLAQNDLRIQFEKYQGKPKIDLLRMVRIFHGKHEEAVELMEKLRSILSPSDWDEMVALPLPNDESLVPPTD